MLRGTVDERYVTAAQLSRELYAVSREMRVREALRSDHSMIAQLRGAAIC